MPRAALSCVDCYLTYFGRVGLRDIHVSFAPIADGLRYCVDGIFKSFGLGFALGGNFGQRWNEDAEAAVGAILFEHDRVAAIHR